MTALTLTTATLAVLALAFLVLAARRLRRRRLLRAGGNGLMAGLFLALAAVAAGLSLELHTYQRLSHEQLAAELTFRRLGEHRYEVHIDLAEGGQRTMQLTGDDWQLDARVLKWKGLPVLLGMDALFRLERLSGRHRDIEQARSQAPTVHRVAESRGIDLWALGRRHAWLPWIDAVYGSATYAPMADEARYRVKVSQSGLIARPLNEAAREAVHGW